MSRAAFAALCAILVAGCKSHDAPATTAAEPSPRPSSTAPDVTPADARALIRTLEAATYVGPNPDPEQRASLLMEGCAEIPSCAGACGGALKDASSGMTKSSDRDAILSKCFPDFRRAHDEHRLSREDWIEGYMAAYADRAIRALEGRDVVLLRDLRAKLHAK